MSKSSFSYLLQMQMDEIHKNKPNYPKKSILKVHRLWLKWQNMSFKSPLNDFLFEKNCHTRYEEKTVNIWPFGYFGGILDTFSLISQPHFIFSFLLSLCDLCGHFDRHLISSGENSFSYLLYFHTALVGGVFKPIFIITLHSVELHWVESWSTGCRL